MGPGFESLKVHHRDDSFIPSYSSLAQSVEHLTVNQVVAGSSPAGGAKKKASRKTCFFLSKPQATSLGLGISSTHKVRCISSAPLGLYLITLGRAFYLQLDDIQSVPLWWYAIPCGIDDMHAFGVILRNYNLAPQHKSPCFTRAFCVFRGKKHHPFTIAPFLEPFGLEPTTFSHIWRSAAFLI